jgi:hypothetical protein
MMHRKPSDHLKGAVATTPRISLTSQLKANAFAVLSVGFGVAALAMIIGATLAPTGQISGESLVLIEVQLLPGFYMKPITFFTYSMFLSFAFGLYTPQTRQRFLSARPAFLRTAYIGAWLVAMGSGFEIVYHIVIWSASLAVQGLSNPDIIVNPFPVSVNPIPINVVFAAKMVVAIFFMAIFLIDYVHRIDRTRHERELAQSLIGSK